MGYYIDLEKISVWIVEKGKTINDVNKANNIDR